ncbi:hypothetical protein EDB83DRAFT_2314156 [Lactarius deliciosus]|nr:hypothetical protein EDB83DRAFT_2314156 [Lactarius deliciosus]
MASDLIAERRGGRAKEKVDAEATLHELDPRHAEQHRGDSDVDWGDSGVAEVEDSEEDNDKGMLVDQDTGTDVKAAFVRIMGVARRAYNLSARVIWRMRRGSAWRTQMKTKRRTGSDGEGVDTVLELADAVRILATGGFEELFCR